MRLVFAICPLLLCTSAFAAESASENMFHADLTIPDLALAVSHFEKTCMPFVLHKSEVTRELNKQHMSKLIENLDYDLVSSEKKSERVLVSPTRESWKAAEQSQKTKKRGQFSVFNGISSQVVESTQTRVGQTGEITGPLRIPATYRTVTRDFETYSLNADDRVSTNLVWNYASQNHPGKSCEIKVKAPKILQTEFSSAFIEKDKDWFGGTERWSQCVRDGDDEFKFTVHHTPDALSIHVKRNDFYASDICRNWIRVHPALP